ncbi:MAG TPA: polysaccharide deacetylase family protein [bacterium]|nr:polysaccharide deacetylase family protein [bacterium]
MRAIVTYHSLDPSGSPISVHPDAFRRHAEWLGSGAVPVRSFTDLMTSDGPGIAVTFDDAFVSFRDLAWPLLRERGIPVTVFVPTDHAGRTNRWPDESYTGIPELPLLDWDALARLATEGVQLGSHTRTHRDLRRLDDDDLQEELESAADRIGEITRRPDVLAYPYGFADARVAAAARRVYTYACTDELRGLREDDDRHLLPRLDAYYFQAPGRLEGFGTWTFGAYMAVRRLGRRVKRGMARG